jgi:hypothetical protein
VGARSGKITSHMGFEPTRFLPSFSQNKPAKASQPFSRTSELYLSARHCRRSFSYSSCFLVAIGLIINDRPASLRVCFSFDEYGQMLCHYGKSKVLKDAPCQCDDREERKQDTHVTFLFEEGCPSCKCQTERHDHQNHL